MSERETLAIIQRSAERWAKERGQYWCPRLKPVSDDGVVASLTRDIDDQGWLPETLDTWGDSPTFTLAQLGRVIARELPAAFMSVLVHSSGLLAFGGARGSSCEGPIATCPYFDFSRTPPMVLASPNGDGWVLDGEMSWVVNAAAGRCCVVAARLSSGVTALFGISLGQTGCSLSPLPVLGLWGAPVHRVVLSSVSLGPSALIATEARAAELLCQAHRMTRWGALGMLLGILERFTSEAESYAEVRAQGGRKINAYVPVRRLLQNMAAAMDCLLHWLQRLQGSPELDYTGTEICRQALRASDSGLQVFGGTGYTCPGLPERCWRDVRQSLALLR